MLETMAEHPAESDHTHPAHAEGYEQANGAEVGSTLLDGAPVALTSSPDEEKPEAVALAQSENVNDTTVGADANPTSLPPPPPPTPAENGGSEVGAVSTPVPVPSGNNQGEGLTRKPSRIVLRRLSSSMFRRRRGSSVASDKSGLSGVSSMGESELPDGEIEPWSRNKSAFPDLETHGTKSGKGYAGHPYVYADVGVSYSSCVPTSCFCTFSPSR